MSFAIRRIRLTFALGQGTFGQTGQNIVTVSGLRVQANILKTGAYAMGEAQLRIHGLTPTVLNALTAIYTTPQLLRQNTVIIEAGDDIVGMHTVFTGGITLAQADLNQQPDSVLNVIAQAGLIYTLQPPSYTQGTYQAFSSYQGPTTVDSILRSLAAQMGLGFENNGVNVTLAKPYLKGSIRDQVLSVISTAGCEWNNGDGGILAIWPRGGNRSLNGPVPVISPENGMIGYPSYSNMGLKVRTTFNPNIIFGGQIEVKSSLPQANYIWNVFGLSYILESEVPNGRWETEINAFSTAAIAGATAYTPK